MNTSDKADNKQVDSRKIKISTRKAAYGNTPLPGVSPQILTESYSTGEKPKYCRPNIKTLRSTSPKEETIANNTGL